MINKRTNTKVSVAQTPDINLPITSPMLNSSADQSRPNIGNDDGVQHFPPCPILFMSYRCLLNNKQTLLKLPARVISDPVLGFIIAVLRENNHYQ